MESESSFTECWDQALMSGGSSLGPLDANMFCKTIGTIYPLSLLLRYFVSVNEDTPLPSLQITSISR